MASWAAIYGHFCEALSLKPWHLVPSSYPHDLEYIRTIINHIARPVDIHFAVRDFWGLRGRLRSLGLWSWTRQTRMGLTEWLGTCESPAWFSHLALNTVALVWNLWLNVLVLYESEFGPFWKHINLKVVGRWNAKIHKIILQSDLSIETKLKYSVASNVPTNLNTMILEGRKNNTYHVQVS